jgi:hypothetical protein
LAQALREGVEFGDLALLGLGEPVLKAVAVATSQKRGEAAGESAGHGNALLRVTHSVTPTQAKTYEAFADTLP